MEIEFAGAAREVTGSCHLVRANGKTIALDFGLFQERRAESEAKNRRLPVNVDALDNRLDGPDTPGTQDVKESCHGRKR